MTEPASKRRAALVTGGGRGIGAAIARRLARDGFHVVVNYLRDEQAALETLTAIEASGGSGESCRFDVRHQAEVHRALAELEQRLQISVLVNNAGIAEDASFPALSALAWENVTRTTLDGFFNVTQPLVMSMVAARFGRIVNIASVSGIVGNRGQVNYSAAKAGLIGATRSLALELAKRKITVNAVAPGLIETDMISAAPLEELRMRIPMQRLGQPDEVASLVSFLVSEQANYITGQVIGINGGLV